MFGVALIAILASLGGAIAYIGDKVGTKVGKRKLTLFGLRPKYTSIIIAVSTGVSITIATLIILTAMSSNVRTALFHMEHLQAELETLSAEVNQKSGELEVNQLRLQAKEQEYNDLITEIDNVTGQLADLKEQLADTVEQRDQTRIALHETQAAYQHVYKELQTSTDSIQALTATKVALDERIASLNRERRLLQDNLDQLASTTGKLREGMQNLRQGTVLYRANEVLATVVINPSDGEGEKKLWQFLVAANQQLLQQSGRKAGMNTLALGVSQGEFQAALRTLKNTPASMVVRLVAHRNTVGEEPVIAHLELYPNKQIFAQGDIIARANIDVGTEPDLEAVVLQFLQQVNSSAVAKGMLVDPLNGTVGSIRGSELFHTVEQLKGKRGDIELQAIALNDTFVAGPLAIKILMEQ
jgi:uncharacterized protein (DUF3084 family)